MDGDLQRKDLSQRTQAQILRRQAAPVKSLRASVFAVELGTSWALSLTPEFYGFEQRILIRKYQSSSSQVSPKSHATILPPRCLWWPPPAYVGLQ